MRKVTPEQVDIICDVCGITTDEKTRKQKGKLYLRYDVLDMHNMPASGRVVDDDLCDSCLQRIAKAINDEAETIRNGG